MCAAVTAIARPTLKLSAKMAELSTCVQPPTCCQMEDMTIRRTNTRDVRRRRVLTDDVSINSGSAGRVDSAEPVLKVFYSDAALADQQPRVTDLIPKNWPTLSLWFAMGVVVIAMHLVLGIVYHDRLAGRQLPFDSLLNAEDPGSLASWTAAMMLMLASLTASLIYWIRRNRIDDYRGRYRMWIYVTGLLVLASLDATVGLRRAIVTGINQAAPETASPTLFHVGFALFGVLVMTRLVAEMRASRGAVTWLMISAAMYGMAGLTQWGWISIDVIKSTSVAVAVLTLSGHWLLTMSMMVYGRYVFLDAQGMISHEVTPKSDLEIHQGEAIDTPENSAGPAAKKRKRKPTPAKQVADDAPDVIRMDAADEVPKMNPNEPERPSDEPDQRARPSSQQNRKPNSQKLQKSQKSEKSQKSQHEPDELDDLELENETRMSKSARKRARKEKRRQQRAA